MSRLCKSVAALYARVRTLYLLLASRCKCTRAGKLFRKHRWCKVHDALRCMTQKLRCGDERARRWSSPTFLAVVDCDWLHRAPIRVCRLHRTGVESKRRARILTRTLGEHKHGAPLECAADPLTDTRAALLRPRQMRYDPCDTNA